MQQRVIHLFQAIVSNAGLCAFQSAVAASIRPAERLARASHCGVLMLTIAVLLALLVGASLGLLGGGGSILTVPILRYVLGMDAHEAIAMSLLVVGCTSLAALIPYARRGRVRFRTGLVFGAAGMTGAFAAGRVAHLIPAEPLLIAFALMMFATAFGMLRSGAAGVQSSPSEAQAKELPLAKVLLEGLVVGGITGLVGAGGGFLVVPALVLLGGLPMDYAVGTSLLVIAMKSFAGFSGFVGHTNFDARVALWITLSALVGSVAGGALALRTKPEALKAGFGWFVLTMAFFVSSQELPRLFGHTLNMGWSSIVAAAGTALFATSRWLTRRFAPTGHWRPRAPRVSNAKVVTRTKTVEQFGG